MEFFLWVACEFFSWSTHCSLIAIARLDKKIFSAQGLMNADGLAVRVSPAYYGLHRLEI